MKAYKDMTREELFAEKEKLEAAAGFKFAKRRTVSSEYT